MDVKRMEALEYRIERAALKEIECELKTTATDDLEMIDLAPWRAGG